MGSKCSTKEVIVVNGVKAFKCDGLSLVRLWNARHMGCRYTDIKTNGFNTDGTVRICARDFGNEGDRGVHITREVSLDDFNSIAGVFSVSYAGGGEYNVCVTAESILGDGEDDRDDGDGKIAIHLSEEAVRFLTDHFYDLSGCETADEGRANTAFGDELNATTLWRRIDGTILVSRQLLDEVMAHLDHGYCEAEHALRASQKGK